jgi:hypothetical protein
MAKAVSWRASGAITTEDAVTGSGNSVRYVVVYISAGGQAAPAATDTVRYDQKGCQYIPHVAVMQAHQPLVVVNDDPTSHNIHPLARVNPEWNKSQPKGAPPIRTAWDQPNSSRSSARASVDAVTSSFWRRHTPSAIQRGLQPSGLRPAHTRSRHGTSASAQSQGDDWGRRRKRPAGGPPAPLGEWKLFAAVVTLIARRRRRFTLHI